MEHHLVKLIHPYLTGPVIFCLMQTCKRLNTLLNRPCYVDQYMSRPEIVRHKILDHLSIIPYLQTPRQFCKVDPDAWTVFARREILLPVTSRLNRAAINRWLYAALLHIEYVDKCTGHQYQSDLADVISKSSLMTRIFDNIIAIGNHASDAFCGIEITAHPNRTSTTYGLNRLRQLTGQADCVEVRGPFIISEYYNNEWTIGGNLLLSVLRAEMSRELTLPETSSRMSFTLGLSGKAVTCHGVVTGQLEPNRVTVSLTGTDAYISLSRYTKDTVTSLWTLQGAITDLVLDHMYINALKGAATLTFHDSDRAVESVQFTDVSWSGGNNRFDAHVHYPDNSHFKGMVKCTTKSNRYKWMPRDGTLTFANGDRCNVTHARSYNLEVTIDNDRPYTMFDRVSTTRTKYRAVKWDHLSGTYTWPDGTVYTGQWMAGTMHGRGTLSRIVSSMTGVCTSVETGEWDDGILDKLHSQSIHRTIDRE